ncbi:isoleucine--tRNA ligase [Fluviicola taffensis]|uniref:Isoleucine--tRNA ligase n=1 Tax=Fluviicola taffensis (strain DSM 16823 / NCIMB 13979 / RW262) TaxID=755732 RepID=F2IDL4_FLUTR|nr:isoleucine--tRNA ligase [Fluviicola taffensis]AEA43387.1 Isoleucyl-tRNA synthetase [Fluviicola taffensis DSM 16823]
MSRKYNEYSGLNLPNVAQSVLEKWKNERVFEASITSREGAEPFVFFEGPPSANGLPGIHHVMARSIKDIFCRYQTLKGKQVKRKAGWDTHGLPVELGVEKELGITKEDIGKKISVDDYNKACREAVMRYTDIWNRLTVEMGYWVDMEDPYITYEPKYMESVWWLLGQLYEKNLMYKGYTIQPYSPMAGTGLSSHELNMPGCYRDVKDTTVVAQFKIADGQELPFHDKVGTQGIAYLLAWTTTPWTLSSNTALCVGPKIEYVLVEKIHNQYTEEVVSVVLAKDRLNELLSKDQKRQVCDNYLRKKYPFIETVFFGDKLDEERSFNPNEAFVFTGNQDKFDSLSKNDSNQIIEFFETTYKLACQNFPSCKGSDLVGIRYEQLLPGALPYENADQAFRVISGDFVTTSDGTGIVHIAPTFGADDARVATESGVPAMLVLDDKENPVPLVDLRGRFRPEVSDAVFGLAGEYVKADYLTDAETQEEFEKQKNSLKAIIPDLKAYMSVDERIALKLKIENKAFKIEKYEHSYPHCWRTEKPVLYYPLDSWFIKVTNVKDRMIALNNTINWKPASTGSGRFGEWLKNANDWNLSRSRYWGIPIPIWSNEDGDERICISSVEQLKAECDKAVSAGVMTENPLKSFTPNDFSKENYAQIDLHKNYMDEITLVSPSGLPMKRESDLIDVWFDSGAMPYAQWHYPFENKELIDNRKSYPADFIAEGVDQTRGWFYTLHAIATMCFDSVAFKNVMSNGLVLDKNGLKMSKSKGNSVDPFETLTKYGPDATRWYMITNAQPWDNLKFDTDGITEVQRKFFGTLYNTYSFFALYANIDGFNYSEAEIALDQRPEIDRWILSKLNSLIAQVDEAYASFEPTKAGRLIQDFVSDQLSNWYVRLCRRRFWKGDYETDKISAYQTLYTCLEAVAIMGSPIAPFYLDQLFSDLNAISGRHSVNSVHLALFPKSNEALIDLELEAQMEIAQNVSSLVLALRAKEKIRVRQPLQKIMVPVLNDQFAKNIDHVKGLILSEVNVKELELLDASNNIFVKSIKANFKTIGPKYGKQMKSIAAWVSQLDQNGIASVEQNQGWTGIVDGDEVVLDMNDFEIRAEDIPGWLVASENGLTVALDSSITETLRMEGVARELVNRIQNLRKDSGLEVTDKISLTLKSSAFIQLAAEANKQFICDEVLATDLKITADSFDGLSTDIEEEADTLIRVDKI